MKRAIFHTIFTESKLKRRADMKHGKKVTLEDYRDMIKDGDITVHLTRDQKAMILKTYDYGLNELTEIDEMLLSAIIRKLKAAIDQ
jgi:hypothetical protein